MVKKLDDAKSEHINFSYIHPQKKYLMDQFGSLMDQVGDGFGGPLQEELIRRLEQTIADFHQEVNEMLTNLRESSEKRHEKLKEIWENPDAYDNDNKLSGVHYERLIAPLIKALQEQKAEIDALKTKVATLEGS